MAAPRVLSLTVPNASGNQSYSGAGVRPTWAYFWGTKMTADGENHANANIPTWYGLAVSSSSRVAFVEGDDGVTSNAVASDATKCIKCVTGASTVTFAADLVSFDSDGLTLNWTTPNATAYVVNYIVGDDSQVSLISLTSGSASGNQAYTGSGFLPGMIVLIGADNSGSNNAISMGFGVSSTQRGASSQAGNATTGGSMQKTTRCYLTVDGGSSVRNEADLVSMDSNGFTLNWIGFNANTHTIYALCLAGNSYYVGSFLQKASTGSQAYTGPSFTPRGILSCSVGRLAGAALSATQCMIVSAVTDTTHRASVQYGSDVFGMSAMDRAAVSTFWTRPSDPPTLLAKADLTSMDSGGLTVNWSSADTVQRETIYAAIGDAPAQTLVVNRPRGMQRPAPFLPGGARERL